MSKTFNVLGRPGRVLFKGWHAPAPTERIYKLLALTLAVLCVIFMLIVSDQSTTIEQQRRLIRKMETNKACMTGTGGNE